jgi:hypothetical protein
MRSRQFAVAISMAVIGQLAATASFAGNDPGFKTARPAQLVPVEPGVIVDPILSTGDIVGTYQMSGIPDGLGAYKVGGNNLRLLMNHELGGVAPESPPGVGARVSDLVINRKTHSVYSGKYDINGTEGYNRFCSSTLEVIEGKAWYFTGEEGTEQGALTEEPSDGVGHGGVSIALNVESGQYTETPQFGRMIHENVVPLERLSKAMLVTTDDDFRSDSAHRAYLYSFIANTSKFSDAIAGNGSLYVWAANGATTTSEIAKGETLDGHFVPISQAENLTADELDLASAAAGGFKFVRLEDAAAAQQHPGRFYFSDTGRVGAESVKGRLYRMDVDPANPIHASATLLLDGDAGDDMVNPDNLDTSPHSVVIQEDRNSEHRDAAVRGGYGRILVYDIDSGAVRVVARVNTPPPLRPGT